MRPILITEGAQELCELSCVDMEIYMNHPTIHTQGHTTTHICKPTHAHGILIPTPNQWSSNFHFQKTKLMAGTMIKKKKKKQAKEAV